MLPSTAPRACSHSKLPPPAAAAEEEDDVEDDFLPFPPREPLPFVGWLNSLVWQAVGVRHYVQGAWYRGARASAEPEPGSRVKTEMGPVCTQGGMRSEG